MKRVSSSLSRLCFGLVALFAALPMVARAQEDGDAVDKAIDDFLEPVAGIAEWIVFFPNGLLPAIPPFVLFALAGTAIFLTIYFRFVNFRAFGLAMKTVRGKLTDPNAPGQITHFQALSAALSATVGLGNIAGVAVAIGIGGPGATFWMILMGLCGMTTKFCECTLGVKYRRIDESGRVHGGAMYYLSKGLAERGLAGPGKVLALIFAIMCVGGTFGAGNMFQVNQAHAQMAENFGWWEQGWITGVIVALLVGAVIIGGIVWIARVTSFLVPFMCGMYVLAAMYIIGSHLSEVPAAFATILKGAFAPPAAVGGFVGVLIQGIRRATFSNEAGFGSAPIAHSAVKTDKPASEGVVALLEPFIDTVVVCTMTALVIVITGMWQVNGDVQAETSVLRVEASSTATEVATLDQGTLLQLQKDASTQDAEGNGWYKATPRGSEESGWVLQEDVAERGGIWLTSSAFGDKISWFPILLTVAVLLFAISTMISWSYYGEQAVIYLFGESRKLVLIYKVVFCLAAIVGASASLGNVLRLSDAMVFGMVLPNLIGVYLLLPVVQREYRNYVEFAKSKAAEQKGGPEA